MIRDRAVAHRYAAALFGAAVKLGREQEVHDDLLSLEELSQSNPAWGRFLEAPDVPADQKAEMISTLLSGRVDDLVVRFLLLMLRKKRVQHLPLVRPHYRILLDEHQGLVRARVQTAIALSPDLAETLRARLERLMGMKIACELTVDPSIIGGVIVTLGGRIIDASIRHQLELLREQLKSAPVRAGGET